MRWKALGQDVQEKAADELGGVERHGLEPVAAFDPVVLPAKVTPGWSRATSRELEIATRWV